MKTLLQNDIELILTRVKALKTTNQKAVHKSKARRVNSKSTQAEGGKL